ncbi:type II secretion system F family protein [Natronomonas salina]|uniref:type II secretion system F family protein n=1 Tax=Natronomonas salina TaxID=1710540 RepID=UPI0015B3E5FD|nr:type II secretion system F family protein [Natronomonas salina]QLD87523.1 type II secretion system F family protein [Natronomonas salina]
MSQANAEDTTPIPDYELEQYFPERHDLSEDDEERLREQHGYVRTWFLMNPDRFRQLQRWLNQARMGYTYDVYLSRVVGYTVMAAAVGLFLGALLGVQLAAFGGWAALGVESPFVAAPLSLLVVVLSVGLFAGGAFGTGYYYPRMQVSTRERNIDILLPHAIVYMYALSHGGMNTFEVIKELAEADEVYGEVANEFDMVVRDVELFGNDVFTALRDARNLTPSENLEQFIDDMISVLDSGSDFATFLEDEAETYMDEARDEQDSFLGTLSILSEIFVVAFVAAPLFLIVTLLVISLLGGEAMLQTYFLVYVGLPLGMVGFLVAVDILSKPYAEHTDQLEIDDPHVRTEWSSKVTEHPAYEQYEEQKDQQARQEMLEKPIRYLREQNPLVSLALTVPAALLFAVVMVVTGAVPRSLGGMLETPIWSTIGVFVIPFLIASVPLTLLYESEHRREKRIASRFPDTLNILSSANQMGIRLVDALNLVARWSDGVLSEELRKVRNDIQWNHDVERALLEFANRLRVPQVTRTMKLIAKGNHSSSDLAKIISIAAEDTRNRYQIERKRRSEMGAYTAIVVIGFLVYLAVIVMLDASYLTPISQLSTETADNVAQQATGGGGAAGLMGVGNVPVDTYRMVFFHSALIQGIGSGLLAGKLAENDVLSGVKYSIGLVAITLTVFALI